MFPNPALEDCEVMNPETGNCMWSEHMHIYMESYEQRNMVENAEIKAIAILAETKQAYEEERAVINKTGAKCDEDYIQLAIRESQVVAEETGDWSKVEGLYNSLADYESQKKLIEQGNTSDGANADMLLP
uniref:Uncharacterized protein n=1 Tax=Ditylenchus dipsaci TaxID=166011 RepID=A0A915CT70_9BILA